ncbi:MAG TPA: ribonuclease J [Kiloniellales bacterium]|nr:ribonuclease J [Kiloniellales bacterium]
MTDWRPGAEELYFLPLGGTGEIGMNLNLYGHAGKWLMVDLGITFADAGQPGVEVLMPDPAFIEERREDLVGLVLTHAHEDHIGAVGHLWSRLRCPIYATAFTASMLEPKLVEAGIEDKVRITELPLSGRFTVGPFEVELITLTHSIPEPNALVVRTAAGSVLHTGDWKLDPDPLIGETYDEKALRALADENVLAMVCDSTNALVDGDSGSEGEVRAALMELVGGLENRVAIACFASNVARLETAGKVAEAHGRRVALIGRSMLRVYQAARDNGYLADFPPLVSEDEVGYLPRREVMLLLTGSQGEPRSALWRIAYEEHPQVELEAGDAVIFSSRIIPGNDVAIFTLQNQLTRKGIEIITDDNHFTHVSGHPAREELTQMYQWVRPRIAIPVHGEARHLAEHARLAAECQVPEQIVGQNGALMRLAPGPAGIVDQVHSGRLALDGNRLLPLDSPVLRDRRRMMRNGSATVTLVIGADGLFQGEPMIVAAGLLEPETEADKLDQVAAGLRQALSRLPAADRRDDEAVKETARRAVRRAFNGMLGKKPVTEVHLVRLR